MDGNPTSETVKEMLLKNFEESYNGKTRAPIGIYIHAAWFVREYSWHYEGYKMFLDEILQRPDVWIVPINSGIEYVKANNLTNDDLMDFEPFRLGCEPDEIDTEDCPEVVCK